MIHVRRMRDLQQMLQKVSVVHLLTEHIERNICQDSININSHENTSNCAVNSWERRMWHYSFKKIVDSLRKWKITVHILFV